MTGLVLQQVVSSLTFSASLIVGENLTVLVGNCLADSGVHVLDIGVGVHSQKRGEISGRGVRGKVQVLVNHIIGVTFVAGMISVSPTVGNAWESGTGSLIGGQEESGHTVSTSGLSEVSVTVSDFGGHLHALGLFEEVVFLASLARGSVGRPNLAVRNSGEGL